MSTGRDVDAEVDQSDDEDFDEAELEKLFNERDVMDLMEELDDDGMVPYYFLSRSRHHFL